MKELAPLTVRCIHNQINNVKLLAKLIKLKNLELDSNQITDIEPLTQLSN